MKMKIPQNFQKSTFANVASLTKSLTMSYWRNLVEEALLKLIRLIIKGGRNMQLWNSFSNHVERSSQKCNWREFIPNIKSSKKLAKLMEQTFWNIMGFSKKERICSKWKPEKLIWHLFWSKEKGAIIYTLKKRFSSFYFNCYPNWFAWRKTWLRIEILKLGT